MTFSHRDYSYYENTCPLLIISLSLILTAITTNPYQHTMDMFTKLDYCSFFFLVSLYGVLLLI
jgi:hypothetical protein